MDLSSFVRCYRIGLQLLDLILGAFYNIHHSQNVGARQDLQCADFCARNFSYALRGRKDSLKNQSQSKNIMCITLTIFIDQYDYRTYQRLIEPKRCTLIEHRVHVLAF